MQQRSREAARSTGMLRLGLVGLGVLVVSLGLAAAAFAAFTAGPATPAMSVASATVAAPTALTATGGCQLLAGPKMTVAWTASTSTFADGYQVLRSATTGGPYSQVGTVTGLATVTFTDTGLATGTTYYYVVATTKGTGWTSVNSSQASGTTPALCL